MNTIPTETTHTTTQNVKKTKPRGRRRTKIEKEIDVLQKSDKNLIPKSCFQRLVKDYLGEGYRITSDASTMLQTETENFIVKRLSKANVLAQLAKRDTVTSDDVKMVDVLES